MIIAAKAAPTYSQKSISIPPMPVYLRLYYLGINHFTGNQVNRFYLKSILLTLFFILPSQLPATESIQNETGIVFVQIPAGEFIMGSQNLDDIIIEHPKGDAAIVKDETPPHRVVFKQSFYLSMTEITQKQWLDVMKNRNGPDSHWAHKNWQQLPVVGVTWQDTQRFIEKLNARDKQFRYRLPSEAEWEYAARAGNSGVRPFPIERLDKHAWYIENSGDIIQPVASRQANAWGLHDMLGNVWEWTNDWHDPNYYANSPLISPPGPADGTKKIRRGASFHCQLHLVRPAYRAADSPDLRYSVLGFRLLAKPMIKP